MRNMMRLVLVPLALSALCSAAEANLVVNGSFENPTVPVGGYNTYSSGSTSITGWTVVGPDVSIVSGTFSSSGILFQAQEGVQWLDLTGPGTNSKADGVTQDVATTAGQSYLLSFHVGSATDNSTFFASTVDLSINGGARVSYTNPTTPSNMLNWEQFTVGFTATGATTNLTFFNGGAPNNNVSALDNVSLVAAAASVPEPSSLVMASIGLLSYWRLRRKKSRGA